jgi:hypothetical protein
MQRENTMENLAHLIDELEIDGKFYYFFFFFFFCFFFFKSDFKYFFFFLEESDSVALYFFLNGYIEEIIEENPEMEQIVEEHGGLPVTMDDLSDWLRDEVFFHSKKQAKI